MNIIYSNNAKKAIKKLNEPIKSRIRQAITNLPDGNIIKMKNYNNAYRLRIGDYRVVYYISNNTTILIDRIGLRGQIYKRK